MDSMYNKQKKCLYESCAQIHIHLSLFIPHQKIPGVEL